MGISTTSSAQQGWPHNQNSYDLFRHKIQNTLRTHLKSKNSNTSWSSMYENLLLCSTGALYETFYAVSRARGLARAIRKWRSKWWVTFYSLKDGGVADGWPAPNWRPRSKPPRLNGVIVDSWAELNLIFRPKPPLVIHILTFLSTCYPCSLPLEVKPTEDKWMKSLTICSVPFTLL